MYKEIFQAVYDINETIEDTANCETQRVYFETDGFTFIVKFLDCTIFNSDDDDRDCYEETGCPILSIKEYLIEEIKDRILMANAIGLVFSKKDQQ